MSASKGLRVIKPLWFAALGSCTAAPLLDGMEPSPGIYLVLWESHTRAAGRFLSALPGSVARSCPAVGTAG